MRFALVLFTAAALLPAAAAPFEAGVARVEITPSTLLPMYGYGNRKGPAVGYHDPLHAKALVLAAGSDRVAIVTLDIGMFYSERLRRRVTDELGIPVLILASSHTHSGPSFIKNREDAPDPSSEQQAYLKELEEKLFGIVKEASANMFPARIGLARGALRAGYNRLVLREDGRARANFDNREHVAYGPVDPEFVLLKIEDISGAARALLVHYACHAVVLQGSNRKYSADYPGVLQARVEEAMKGVQCMFVQGGAGDINPLSMGQTGEDEEDFKAVRRMGDALAREVLTTANTIRTTEPARPEIRAKAELLTFADRWNKNETVEAGITTVLINREIAIAAVPGEPLHRLQTFWKANADVAWPLFYGYSVSSAETWPGYIPDLRSAAYGGYGADVSTNIEVGAAERIMQRHLINLYGLRDMWLDKPGKN
ncbi:MAG TPA: neutral/alkaline non-lysosomal ceramidase N-terminal domain-containing protein [Bryobacteraceae bacterium]|nr:neutral/alkaline non-lysosomal ceramidase N-terminal domain-containing protein [Bryobacteraceae bacterium]